MYDLHIANKNYSSWSLRPWVLMTERAIPFREHLHEFPARDVGATFRAFSPSGRVPALHDGDAVVWDSLAIVEYLAERHPGVWPADADARRWARCAAAEMHAGFTALRERCTMNCGVRVRLRDVPPALAGDLARLGELWLDGLDRHGGPFLAGPTFTAVDAFYAPVAFRIQTYGLDLAPRALAYAAQLRALPSMQRWYADGIAETWRHAAHEADLAATGTIVEDLRAR